MSQMTLTLSRENAPAFIAEIVKQGLTFDATESGDSIVITFTGGY